MAAFEYHAASLPSVDQLRTDALFMAGLLGGVYRIADVQPIPGGPPPEILEAIEAADEAAGKKYSKPGKRFRRSAAQRKAIELHAMAAARTHYESEGWSVIDTSNSKPYDFLCRRGGERLLVEVKGTTSDGSSIVLTRNEVDLHNAEHPNTALAIVHGIVLGGEKHEIASSGELRLFEPFTLDEAALTVISFSYDVPD